MWVVGSFALCMLLFAVIGAASMRVKRATSDDYLLAGRDVPAWLAALSAVATNNSGYMFIGQIGFTYTHGVQSIWLAIGWILGDALVWWKIHRRVRELSEEENALSVPTLIGGRARSRMLIMVSAILVLAFLGTYAAAQLQAGSKALHAVLGWDERWGAVIGAIIVLLYSYSGGLRASIWTDAAQSFVMLGAMGALLFYALASIGGPVALLGQLERIDPSLVDPLASDAPWGFTPWALGWLGGGLGVLGQPTILARTMSLQRPSDVPRAGLVYFGFFIPFYMATIMLGLCSRVLLPQLSDAELAMPTLAAQVFPDLLVGLMLAGVFAATMSTADSQIIACSAALTEDLPPTPVRSYTFNKLATAGVTVFALAVALSGSQSVLALVFYAWAALAVTLGPLIMVRAFGLPLPTAPALVMMGAGLTTMFGWQWLGWDQAMYEILPGMCASGLVYAGAAALGFISTSRASLEPTTESGSDAAAPALAKTDE